MSRPARTRADTMTPLLRLVASDPNRAGDPGHDEADELVAQFMAAADADNTTRTYASVCRGFTAWCAANGYTALPATPKVVARYLAQAAADPDRALKADTFTVWCAGIARMHADAGYPDPTIDATVRRTLRGIRKKRIKAGETVDQAPALAPLAVAATVAHIHGTARTWRQQVAARRDIALLVLLCAAALRRSEALGLQLGDLSVVDGPDPDRPRLRIRLRGSKTSQIDTEYLYLERGRGDALSCPWCALIRWQVVLDAIDEARTAVRARLRAAGLSDAELATGAHAEQIADAASIACQRLLRRDTADPHEHRCTTDWPAPHRARATTFRALSHGGVPHERDTTLTGQAAGRIVTARAAAAGAGPARGHSLRAGQATFLYDNGATDAEVMAKGRWKLVETARRYDRNYAQRAAALDTGL